MLSGFTAMEKIGKSGKRSVIYVRIIILLAITPFLKAAHCKTEFFVVGKVKVEPGFIELFSVGIAPVESQ